jgi:hypothetical protein
MGFVKNIDIAREILTRNLIDKHLIHCQGGFRVGLGVKEQLWALLEFMEEGDTDDRKNILHY